MSEPFPAEVVKDATIPNAWRVEKLDSDGDGGVDVTIFAKVPPGSENVSPYNNFSHRSYE